LNKALSKSKKITAENNVIKIIKKEWSKEMERITKKNQPQSVNKIDSKCLVQSGHAEIESNKILFVFGNALEVLHR